MNADVIERVTAGVEASPASTHARSHLLAHAHALARARALAIAIAIAIAIAHEPPQRSHVNPELRN